MGETWENDKEEPIQDVMQEDQRPTEWEDYNSSNTIVRDGARIKYKLMGVMVYF